MSIFGSLDGLMNQEQRRVPRPAMSDKDKPWIVTCVVTTEWLCAKCC